MSGDGEATEAVPVEPSASKRPLWEVVGGADRGILVRTGKSLSSWEAPGARLFKGALVRELEVEGDRLRYHLLDGEGPPTGWLSLKLKGNDLLVRSSREAPQPAEDVELEQTQAQVVWSEGAVTVRLKVIAYAPRGDAKSKCALVFCSGNPSQQFNGDHCGSPLALGVEAACREAGVAFVRFDYRGVGINSKHPSEPQLWTLPSMEQAEADASRVLIWAKKNLSKNVAIAGYSYGASVALTLALNRQVPCYVGLSIAPLVYKFAEPGPAQEASFADTERHKDLDLPALLIVGTADRMTPRKEVDRLTQSRKDGGAGVAVREVEGGDHPMKGHEEEAGIICAEWVKEFWS